ncbi:transposase [candidate division MSBL1 archaeon SCGC-AAA259O05]|uniref:Transposase n=1 Tax=candidate division MSBL1 archaeon SCGC-AAA259O05 TaxID=1698271 RepID=A0A133UZP3_9EURY|nr:transposase [candidate division MSBL1 archaeon SCGC-AAA259O05]
MYDVLDLYQEPHDPERPVVGVDERPKQLIGEKKKPIPMKPGRPERVDYEYVRNGSVNVFVAVDPKGGKRDVKVTDRRTKQDFATYIKRLVDDIFSDADTIRLVSDNLNTPNEDSLYQTFDKEEADRILDRIKFHYTPKHGSWLNVAEIEISAMDAECTGRRIEDRNTLVEELKAWLVRRNGDEKKIDWRFTKEDADQKLSKHYLT